MRTLILSDLHLHPSRQAGTTMESRNALEDWQFKKLGEILEIPHDELLINGDLFDKNSVSEKTLLKIYKLLKGENHVILSRGNHCENSMTYGNISSLELLAGLLVHNCTLVFDEPEQFAQGYVIPHCFDQATFDKHIENCPSNKTVFLHCNFDNHYTVEADHSLNLSKAQFDGLVEKGCDVMLGHEHKFEHKENIFHLGCSCVTSIADALGGDKNVLILDDSEDPRGDVTIETVWSAKEDYIELEHTDIKATKHKFVRVNGSCTMSEYPAVVRQIAELRRKSDAFIIANNVKVKVSETEVLDAEDVTNFNIIELLLERIDEEFKEDVKTCL